jgi:xylan 1,4-beta-xylosidase
VDGLATRDGDRIAVALWHHVDDQYARTPPAEVTVVLRNAPFAADRARVRHWRIDPEHSNAYTVWQAMGRPQDPTPDQLAVLKAHQGLEEGDPVEAAADGEGGLRLRLELPLHALSLLEVDART